MLSEVKQMKTVLGEMSLGGKGLGCCGGLEDLVDPSSISGTK